MSQGGNVIRRQQRQPCVASICIPIRLSINTIFAANVVNAHFYIIENMYTYENMIFISLNVDDYAYLSTD